MRYGTKEELEAAKDDATLLPYDVIFKSHYGVTNGKEVFREQSEWNDSMSVYMVTKDHPTGSEDSDYADFHCASKLEAINV